MLKVLEISPSTTFDLKLDCDGAIISQDLHHLVEILWQAEQTRRGKAMHDGSIMSAVRASATCISGSIIRYRYLIAQQSRPELFSQLRIRPVAVSGLLRCHGGLVFGRRGHAMTQDAGLWELVPSGGIDTSLGGDTVDYGAQILTELNEEIGISAADIASIRPFCLIEDTESHVLDLGISLVSSLAPAEVLRLHRKMASTEYDELRIVADSQLEGFMADEAPRMVAASMALLRQSRRASLM